MFSISIKILHLISQYFANREPLIFLLVGIDQVLIGLQRFPFSFFQGHESLAIGHGIPPFAVGCGAFPGDAGRLFR